MYMSVIYAGQDFRLSPACSLSPACCPVLTAAAILYFHLGSRYTCPLMSSDPHQVIDYGHASDRPFPWRLALKVAVAVLVIALLLWTAIYYAYVRPRAFAADKRRCYDTLRAIGCSISLYQQHYMRARGPNPPNLQALVSTQQIPPYLFSCPVGKRYTPASSSIPMPQLLAAMSNPYAYIYVAAGMTVNAPPAAIYMLEDPANHNMTGGHVLYADGSVVFLPLTQLMPCFNDLAAGRNPPTSPPMTPSAARDDYQKNWQSRMPLLKTGVWAIPATQPAGKLKEADAER